MKLTNDICRCWDDQCPRHQECLRWLERNAWDQLVSMHGSLRKPGADSCHYQIRPEDHEREH